MGRHNYNFLIVLIISTFPPLALSEDPYIFYTWDVKYETLSPLDVPQKVITVNGQFPGPRINCTSNNNIVVNVFNKLDEPLLFTWNGVQQRKNSWQEGTLGTNCPIPPGTNYTYRFQVKDQIGTCYYYPTTSTHRAAGGYGPIIIHSRPLIPVPFDKPQDDYMVFVGDWYKKSHTQLKTMLDNGTVLGRPDGILINGKAENTTKAQPPMFTMIPGKTYRYRFCNVGLKHTINVRFQGHNMKLVELEGSHTVQNMYDSLDVHLGQCYSVLVTADKVPAKDYYLVASTRFTKSPLVSTATIRYVGGKGAPAAELPPAPENVAWSINQFRSFRWNLTASAARPNPQGSYHYGQINITRTIKLVSAPSAKAGAKRVYAVNGVSHIDPETPVKLAQVFGVENKVFKYNLIGDVPPVDETKVTVAPNVMNVTYKDFIEIILENHDKTVQSWHMSGYAFFAVGIEAGTWTPEKRKNYNLEDAVSRHTIQIYPGSWTAIMTTLDNAGMWNLRSVGFERQYLGEQLYLNVQSPVRSPRDEYPMPENFLRCGVVKGLPNPPSS